MKPVGVEASTDDGGAFLAAAFIFFGSNEKVFEDELEEEEDSAGKTEAKTTAFKNILCRGHVFLAKGWLYWVFGSLASLVAWFGRKIFHKEMKGCPFYCQN